MFKKMITIIIILCTVGCRTLETAKDSNNIKDNNKTETNNNNQDNNKSEIKENNSTKEEISTEDEITKYGQDSEIQSIYTNGKKYYVLNAENIEDMTENEIKNSSLVAPLKITEETINGNDGIVIKYYDVQIFLGKKNRFGGTKVGLFEPQYRAWTIGEDNKRNDDIELKLKNSTVTITIKRGSISLRYY